MRNGEVKWDTRLLGGPYGEYGGDLTIKRRLVGLYYPVMGAIRGISAKRFRQASSMRYAKGGAPIPARSRDRYFPSTALTGEVL